MMHAQLPRIQLQVAVSVESSIVAVAPQESVALSSST
jgi:hypothetical protein